MLITLSNGQAVQVSQKYIDLHKSVSETFFNTNDDFDKWDKTLCNMYDQLEEEYQVMGLDNSFKEEVEDYIIWNTNND